MLSKIIVDEEIAKAKKLIYDADKIAVIAHSAPDGDAVGSSMALYHALFSLDKETFVIYPDPYPSFLNWINSVDKAVIYSQQEEEAEAILSEVDLIICVDFNDPKRIGDLKDALLKAEAPKVLLDHHPFPSEEPWALSMSYPEIASASELVFRLICRIGHASEINKYSAEAIYTGMMTDTGGFTFNSNDEEVYYIISELIRRGIDKDEIYKKVFNTYTADRMRLMGYVLSEKMKIFPEQKTALIVLTAEEQEQFNFQKGDAEGFVNMPLSIDGVIFSAFFREDPEKIKISFRSQGTFPVNEFSARFFNGGGHLNAAGGESYMSLQETISLFENALPEYTEQLNEELPKN